METILVLTDFSAVSHYAASYACVLAKQLKVPTLVLYHSYQTVIAPSETITYLGDEESLKKVAMQALEDQGRALQDQLPMGTTLRYRTDTRLLDEASMVAAEEAAVMIVMGTTGKSKLQEMVSGSNAIQVCETSHLPVVLVPAEVLLEPIGSIVFACDMKETGGTLPTERLTNVLDMFPVPLSVLHVEKEEQGLLPEEVPEMVALNKLLQPYRPAYQSIKDDDTATGILEFAKQRPASIVLVIAKRHGFPSGLFHRSITKQLAFHTTIPLMVLQAKEKEPAPLPVIPLLEI